VQRTPAIRQLLREWHAHLGMTIVNNADVNFECIEQRVISAKKRFSHHEMWSNITVHFYDPSHLWLIFWEATSSMPQNARAASA
jgi:hypothetical protein